MIGFIDHPSRWGDPGDVAVVDLAGHKKTLCTGFSSIQGLAWSASGDEIWFTGTPSGSGRALSGVSLSGKQRLIYRIPGILNLLDVARNGRVLLARDDWRVGIIGLAPGAAHEEDLSWMDFSAIRDFSPDGKLLLFDESGEAGGTNGEIYLRKMDGSLPVRLAEGSSDSLSRDTKWVLTTPDIAFNHVAILPTGTGEPQQMDLGQFTFQWGNFLPDGRRVICIGNEPNHGTRIYLFDIPQAKPRPITPEGVSVVNFTRFVSPDGKQFLAVEPDGTSSIRSTETGEGKPIAGLEPGEVAFGWTGDGQSVYVYRSAVPVKVFEVELASGKRKLWKELNPPDPAGINFIRTPHISADGKSYAYNYNRILSDLFLVDGLK